MSDWACVSLTTVSHLYIIWQLKQELHLVREQDDIAYDQCKYLLGLWMDFKRASFIRSFICPNSESFSWNSTPTYIPQLSSEKYRVTFLLEKIYILLVGLSCTHHPRSINLCVIMLLGPSNYWFIGCYMVVHIHPQREEITNNCRSKYNIVAIYGENLQCGTW